MANTLKKQIGWRIRKLGEGKRMTLANVPERTSLSKRLLRRIENAWMYLSSDLGLPLRTYMPSPVAGNFAGTINYDQNTSNRDNDSSLRKVQFAIGDRKGRRHHINQLMQLNGSKSWVFQPKDSTSL